MIVKQVPIPVKDLIAHYLPGNYSDAFECVIKGNDTFRADDYMIAFWTSSPKWVDALFKFRDWLVKPFGIEPGSNRSKEQFETAVRTGGSYGFLKVMEKSTAETVICISDKHLKMYFSIAVQQQSIGEQMFTASTIVYFHNRLGRVYFFFVRPFHKRIVISMMKAAINKLLQQLNYS